MSKPCPECGAPIGPTAPAGLCPRCLFGLSLCAEAPGDENAPAGPPQAQPSAGAPRLCRLGDYELLEEIGRGGMGVVYRARQISLKRIVAVKVLPAAQFADAPTRERFQSEARMAASLRHPHIVAIIETGQEQGCPYFAMEYVEGWTLDELLRRQPLSARQAARYVERIALAIEYAHQRGILHRDLKPSNVVIDENDQPRVTDFGLAKWFGGSRDESRGSRAGDAPAGSGSRLSAFDSRLDLTLSGAMLGSPGYMPPEQAGSRRSEIGPRSDIYSLGAILYHLLTGRPPFLAGTLAETLHHLTHTEPAPPRLLQPGVPADLETICLKCLEKEPAKRYATAQALADELGRFLRDEPIHARPVSQVEKAWRWCRRKPALAGLWAATFLLLVAAFAGVALAGLRSVAVRKAEQREYFAGITLADNYVRIGDIQRALNVLTNCPPRFRHWEWGRLMYLCHQEIATIHTVTNLKMAIVGGIDYARIIVNADQTRLITVGEDGAATVWELKTGAKLFSVGGSTNRIVDMAFSPDGRRLALLANAGAVELWEATEARRLFGFLASNGPVRNVTFSGDGTRVRITTADSASTWESPTGRFVSTTPALPGKFQRLTLDPSGTRLATVDARRKVQIWEAETGQLRHTLDGRFSDDARLIFSPDGKRLLVAGPSAAPSTAWNTETGQELGSLNTRVDVAAFNADGSRVATASRDNVARVWSATSGREILSLKGHAATVRFIAFSPDSERVTTASEDGAVKTWRANLGREYTKTGLVIEGLAFSPDAKRLAVAHDEHLATVWDIESGRHVLSLEGHLHRVNKVAYSSDGKRLVTSSFDKTARVWDAETGRLQITLRGHSNLLYAVAISPDGRYVASCGDRIRVWDITAGGEPRVLRGDTEFYIMSLAFSPDGKHLATGGADRRVILWNHKTGERQRTLDEHTERVWSVAFRFDGRMLATAGYDRMIHLWDPNSGKLLRTLRGHFNIYSANFSPDGKRLIAATGEHMPNFGRGSAQVWDVETGRELIVLEGHTSTLGFAAFSPDGRRVATADWNGLVRVWESFSWREQDYPGASTLPIGQRAALYARDYWKQRLAVDAGGSQPDNRALFAQSPRIDRSEFPARAASVPPNLIDLTEHYNALLTVSWFPSHNLPLLAADLSSLPGGTVSFASIPFDVRGVIQLRAPSNNWLESGVPNLRRLPERVEGIRVGGKFAHLHALMGSVGKEPDGTAIGSYVLHYADGLQQEVQINYGEHVRDWWSGADAREDIRDGSLAWRGTTHLTRALGGEIRVFVSRFENPRPDMTVERIDFVSKLTGSGPFLIALTIEP